MLLEVAEVRQISRASQGLDNPPGIVRSSGVLWQEIAQDSGRRPESEIVAISGERFEAFMRHQARPLVQATRGMTPMEFESVVSRLSGT